MLLKTFIVRILVFLALTSESYGNPENQVRLALLKFAVSKTECEKPWPRGELTDGVKNMLRHVSSKDKENWQPEPEYLKKVSDYWCASGNFKNSLLFAGNPKERHTVDSPVENSIDTSDDNSIDFPNELTESYIDDSTSRSTPFSRTSLVSFLLGSVFGSLLAHYFFLLKTTSVPTTKGLRRPEL